MKEALFNTNLFLLLRCDTSMYEKSFNNNKVYILGPDIRTWEKK